MMQTHGVHTGDQKPRGPSGPLDGSGISSLISPSWTRSCRHCRNTLFLFRLSHGNTHQALVMLSQVPGTLRLAFLLTCVSCSWQSRPECTCEKASLCWGRLESSSPSSSSAIIYYLSYTAHIFNYLPLAAVLNELFTLC